MDPTSVIGVALAVGRVALNVSQTLYTFIKATKKVDESVKLLHAEVDGLNRVLDALNSSLDNPIIKSTKAASQVDEELWSSIDGSLSDCRRTVDELADILNSVIEKKKSKNPFRQPARQIRLNLNEDGIRNFRAQIHTHTMNLQLALHTINLLISCLAPERIIDHIGPKIEALTEMIAKLEKPAELTINRERRGTVLQTERLKKSAAAMLSSASTVAATRSTEWNGSEERFASNSVYGEPLSITNRGHIGRWIASQSIDEYHEGENIIPVTRSQEKQNHGGGLAQLDLEASKTFDSDDETEFEAIQKYLEMGHAEYCRNNFARAEILLQRGVKQAEKLSWKNRSLLDLKLAILRRAMAFLRLEKLEDSEKVFRSLSNEQAASESDAAHTLFASHALADICMHRGDFEAAQIHCQKALVGRRRVFGNVSPQYYSSLKLLASTYARNADPLAAAVYAELIPSEFGWLDADSLLVPFLLLQHKKKQKNPTISKSGSEASNTPKVIIGIDLGSTSTAIAFCLRNSPGRIETLGTWPGTSELNIRVPNSVSYDRETGELVGWGFKVDPQNPKHQLEEIFTLFMDPGYQDPFRESPPPSELQLCQWFVQLLNRVQRHILHHMEQVLPSWSTKTTNIRFSVPAAWIHRERINVVEKLIEVSDFGAKRYNSVEVSLTEAKATAFSCAQPSRRGTVILLCNLGQRKAEVNLLEQDRQSSQRNFTSLSFGEDWTIGTVFIDLGMQKLLIKLLEPISEVLEPDLTIVARKMMGESWESFKRNFQEDDLGLPEVSLLVPGLQHKPSFHHAKIKDSSLLINRKQIKVFFDEQVGKLYKILDGQLEVPHSAAHGEIKWLVLCGELATVPYVQSKLMSRYGPTRLYYPDSLIVKARESAASHGLVMHGIEEIRATCKGYPISDLEVVKA